MSNRSDYPVMDLNDTEHPYSKSKVTPEVAKVVIVLDKYALGDSVIRAYAGEYLNLKDHEAGGKWSMARLRNAVNDWTIMDRDSVANGLANNQGWIENEGGKILDDFQKWKVREYPSA